MNVRTAVACAACILATSAFAGGENERGTAKNAHGSDGSNAPTKPTRMCYGGLEDGKAVVPTGRLNDAETETTFASCRIDGGAISRAPQSPTIAAGRPVVA